MGKPSRVKKKVEHYEVEETGIESTPSKFHRAEEAKRTGYDVPFTPVSSGSTKALRTLPALMTRA